MTISNPNHKNHILAFLFIILCSTGYLFDVLFLDKHLSAFDFVMEKSSWQVDFGKVKAQNIYLSDSPTAHYPYKKEFWEAARQGYNPQYLPHIFTGKPTTGQGMGIFSTSLFQFFMDIPNAMDFSTWFRLILAGIFMYLLLVQVGLGTAAASLGAIAWTYNLHQVAWLMFPQHLATQLWLPLLLSINLLFLQRPKNLAVILGLILSVVFFFTSGYTQIVLYTFIFIGLFNTLYVLIVYQAQLKDKLLIWLQVHGIYIFAGILLLPDALSQAQEISEGLRGSQEFRYNRYQLDFSPASLLQLVKDFLPRPIEVIRYFTANYHSDVRQIPPLKNIFKSNVVEYQVFFGFLCLYFSAFGLIKSLIARNRLLIVWVLILLFCIALQNGNVTLISLLNLIPFAGSGTYSRIVTLVLLCAIIIAAYGLGYFVEDMRQRRYFTALMAFGLLLLWLVSARLAIAEIVLVREFYVQFAALFMFVCISAILGWFSKTRWIAVAVVLVTLVELVSAGYRFNSRLDSAYHFPENQVIKKIKSYHNDYRTALLMDHPGYQHNLLSYYDISTLGGYETTAPNDYLYFMRNAYQNVHVTLNGILFLFEGNLEILRLLSTGYIVSNLGLKSELIEPVFKNDVETLFKFKHPLPRAYCASNQLINSNLPGIPSQLAQIAKSHDRPVILTSPVVEKQKLTANCDVNEINVYTSKLELKVQTDEPTLVFIPTNYHQYWRAEINDHKAPIHKANYTFMAIKVDAGTSEVTLKFINTKLTIAALLLIILGIASLVVGFTIVRHKWQKLLFVLIGILLIGKNLMSVPGVMNQDIPERPAIEDAM